MKFIPGQDYREKRAAITRLAANIRARQRPFEPTLLTDADRAKIEDVTRFEQFKGQVYKQCGNRQRDFSARERKGERDG